MIITEKEFLEFMDANGFLYERLEHPAVFTCAEADLHHAGVEAVSTKNLFLCDKKARRFFLAVTACEKSVKLDELTSQLGVAHLRFGSEENLMRLLGVTRGSVTMMGLALRTILGAQACPWRSDLSSALRIIRPVWRPHHQPPVRRWRAPARRLGACAACAFDHHALGTGAGLGRGRRPYAERAADRRA